MMADSNRKVEGERLVLVMVGLPARGKSLIAGKGKLSIIFISCKLLELIILELVVRYLNWLSINARTFNVGQYRRVSKPNPTAEFFKLGNAEGERVRRAAAELAVNDMVKWFNEDDGVVAVLDATNSTKDRRRWIQQRCQSENLALVFVESICDDASLIRANVMEVKTSSPDYKNQDPEEAAQDFMERIRNYESVYQSIDERDEDDLTYVKLINVGRKIVANRLQDFLQTRCIYFLTGLHIKTRSVWLSRVSIFT